MPAINQLFSDLRDKFGIERVFVNGTGWITNFPRGIRVSGANVSASELAALDVTAGTETASKAVVLDSSRLFDSGRLSKKILSNTAASSTLAATTATAFSNGTATIAASYLEAGDTLRFRATVRVASVDGTDSFQALVKYAGATIFDSTAVGSVIQGDLLVIEGEIVARTVHASTGTAYASTVASGVLGATTFSGAEQVASLTSLANAASHTLVVQGAFGGAGNTAVLESFTVYHN